jgi:hypothetical protein
MDGLLEIFTGRPCIGTLVFVLTHDPTLFVGCFYNENIEYIYVWKKN